MAIVSGSEHLFCNDQLSKNRSEQLSGNRFIYMALVERSEQLSSNRFIFMALVVFFFYGVPFPVHSASRRDRCLVCAPTTLQFIVRISPLILQQADHLQGDGDELSFTGVLYPVRSASGVFVRV